MAFLSPGESSEEVLADINVTPLVDVMLVLLIIFMIASPMLHRGVEVSLPDVAAEVLPLREQDPMVLSVTKDDIVYMKDVPVHVSQLTERLLPALEARGQKTVFLKADQDVLYGSFASVLDLLYQAGIEDVALVMDPNAGRGSGR